MANKTERTAQSSTKRIDHALNLINKQGILLTCSDYGLDYFQVLRDFECQNPGMYHRKNGSKLFAEYARKRILERASKGTPSYWVNRAYRDLSEAKRFAIENSRFIRTMERSARGFAAVDAEQVSSVAKTSVCY